MEVTLYSHAGTGYTWALVGLPTNVALTDVCSSQVVPLPYSIGLGKARRALTSVSEATGLRDLVQSFIRKGEYQLAGIAIERLLATCQTDPELFAQYGDVSCALGNLALALEAHRKALELEPGHVHAKRGLQTVLCAMGEAFPALEAVTARPLGSLPKASTSEFAEIPAR